MAVYTMCKKTSDLVKDGFPKDDKWKKNEGRSANFWKWDSKNISVLEQIQTYLYKKHLNTFCSGKDVLAGGPQGSFFCGKFKSFHNLLQIQ